VSESEKNPAGRSATAASGRVGYRARVERIFDHADDVRSLFIRSLTQPIPPFIPGMFISITLPLADGERVRPYTVASSPEDGEPFEIVFNRVPGGPGAAWLFARAVGDEFSFTGPYGAFTLAAAPDAELVFIAETTAIAPIRPMIRRALAASSTHRVELLYAADRPDHLLYQRELSALAAANPRLRIATIVIEGGSEALYARLGDEIRRRWITADTDRSRHFYVCGVGAGVIALRDLLRGAGYERRAVHYEKW
jgi:3-ketosteroid 9alpha-monooxygenase subunit B